MLLHLWVPDRGPWQTALALNCERLMQLRMRDRVPSPHDLLQDLQGDQDVQTPGSDNNQKEIGIKKEEQSTTSLLQDTSLIPFPASIVCVVKTIFLFSFASLSRMESISIISQWHK